MLTVPQVFALGDAIDPRYRALVLLATFTSLRWGELCALRPSDIDMEARTVRVERSLTELQNGALAFGPPKSDAGRRTVGFPELIAPVVRWHLSCFAQDGVCLLPVARGHDPGGRGGVVVSWATHDLLSLDWDRWSEYHGAHEVMNGALAQVLDALGYQVWPFGLGGAWIVTGRPVRGEDGGR